MQKMAEVNLNPKIELDKPSYQSKYGEMTFAEQYRVNPKRRMLHTPDTVATLLLKVEKEMEQVVHSLAYTTDAEGFKEKL